MGWRKTIRSVAAANRRVEKARHKVVTAGNQQLAKIERDSTQIMEKARRLEGLLEKDVIKALNIRYVEGTGFLCDSFEISAGMYSGSFSLTPANCKEDVFKPAVYEIGDSRVEVLGMLITQWATVVAIKVESQSSEYRVRVNWVKKSNRADSHIVLMDDSNSQYYYPIATDLGGEVFPGIPKTGLVAFERFRAPTSDVKLRVAGVRFTIEKFEPELLYRYHSSTLEKNISESLAKPSLRDYFQEQIQWEVDLGKQVVHNEVKKATSGCLVMLGIPAIFAVTWMLSKVLG